jgi:hypothetical protein
MGGSGLTFAVQRLRASSASPASPLNRHPGLHLFETLEDKVVPNGQILLALEASPDPSSLAARRCDDPAQNGFRGPPGYAKFWQKEKPSMTTFTIDCDNNITAFASLEQAQAADIAGSEYFSSLEEIEQLAQSWPVAGARGGLRWTPLSGQEIGP